MNYDKYGEIINGKETYYYIAKALSENKTVGIGWSDQNGTHLDIIFKCGITKYGHFQRGIKSDDLFIFIIGHGAYGFDVYGNEIEPGYLGQKMNGISLEALTELINKINVYLKNFKDLDDNLGLDI